MVFLCFGLENDKLSLLTQSVVKGNMRLPPTLEPTDGFYHRLLSRSGEILAQGVTPDPRVVHFDYPSPDGSGRLTGGVLKQSNVQFAVRYPLIPGADRLEVFLVDSTADLSRLSEKGGRYQGSFKINVETR